MGANGHRNAGDPDREGSFALSAGSTNICHAYVVKAIDRPTTAHIYKAKAGKNGDSVVMLQVPSAGNPGVVSECLQNQNQALVEDIIEHPTGYYVNVVTTAYPNGGTGIIRSLAVTGPVRIVADGRRAAAPIRAELNFGGRYEVARRDRCDGVRRIGPTHRNGCLSRSGKPQRRVMRRGSWRP